VVEEVENFLNFIHTVSVSGGEKREREREREREGKAWGSSKWWWVSQE
jgi:hypothetical protein